MNTTNFSESENNPLSKYVTEKNLATIMNKSPWTIRRYRLQCGMPYIQVGGRFYYSIDDVNEWFASNTKVNLPLPKAKRAFTASSPSKKYQKMKKIS